MTQVITREERLALLAAGDELIDAAEWAELSHHRPIRGAAVPTVFHGLDAIRQLATRTARMADGRVVASGTADEILSELEAMS